MNIAYLQPLDILDAEGGKLLLDQIQAKLSLNIVRIHLNFANVNSIDEDGLDFLLQALEQITDAHGRLLFFTINESVHSFLAELGLDLIFEIYP